MSYLRVMVAAVGAPVSILGSHGKWLKYILESPWWDSWAPALFWTLRGIEESSLHFPTCHLFTLSKV